MTLDHHFTIREGKLFLLSRFAYRVPNFRVLSSPVANDTHPNPVSIHQFEFCSNTASIVEPPKNPLLQ